MQIYKIKIKEINSKWFNISKHKLFWGLKNKSKLNIWIDNKVEYYEDICYIILY